MSIENLIPANDFCSSHNVEITFIKELETFGLIETTELENTTYIQIHQLPDVEKYVRLYYELNINYEGIEAISHILQRVEDLQQKIMVLQNRLKRYENL